MCELTRPTLQICFGGHLISNSDNCSNSSSLINNEIISNNKRRSQQYYSNRSSSITSIRLTTSNLLIGNKGRRLSERNYLINGNQITTGRLERSNSVLINRNGNNNLNFLPELNTQQVLNLRRSWKHINTKGLYDVVRRAFSKLESSSPNIRLAFQNNLIFNEDNKIENKKLNNKTNNNYCCGIMEHTRFFLSLLDRIIEGDNNNNEEIEKELRLIGACHVFIYEYFNLTIIELEKLGEILAEQFFKLDGIRQSKEITKIWRTLIAHIIDYIRDGFEIELRLKKRKQTTNKLLLNNNNKSLDNNNFVIGNSTVEMALAPFEQCCGVFKRNSMPGIKRQTSSSSFLFNNNITTTSSLNKNNNNSLFKTELSNITKKLNNI